MVDDGRIGKGTLFTRLHGVIGRQVVFDAADPAPARSGTARGVRVLTSGRRRATARRAAPTEPLPLEIAPAELARLRAARRSYALLDVREPWEVAICGFAEAIHLPLGALAGREHELPRDRPLIVVCHTGRRSLLATQYLRRLGLERRRSICAAASRPTRSRSTRRWRAIEKRCAAMVLDRTIERWSV